MEFATTIGHATTADWEDMLASAARLCGPPESEVLGSLRVACDMCTPVSLLAAHMVLSCAGHLRSASPQGVVIELPRPPHESLEGAMVAVSFPVAGRSAGFTAPVIGVQVRPDRSVLVTVAVPERIHTGVQRASVRVPVPPRTVSAALLRGEALQRVEAIDLSLRGILVEFARDQVPDIETGHRRMVVLKFAGRSVLLEAEVRRRDGPRYGMLFMIRGERPSGLVEIVRKLQYLWSAR